LASNTVVVADLVARDSDPECRARGRPGAEAIKLPARSPNLNAIAERWVRSVKDDGLSKIILFGERSLRGALEEYQLHYHRERNHPNEIATAKGTSCSSRKPVSAGPKAGSGAGSASAAS